MELYDTSDFEALLEELQEEDFCTTSESSVSDEAECISVLQPVRPKRKRHRIRKRLPSHSGPVIVKHDIRRSYFTMITNVLNTGDFGLLYGFMDTFLVPDAQSLFKRSVEGHVVEDCVLSLTGVFNAAQQWCNHLTISPDALFATHSFSLEPSSGKIIGNMNFTGTTMYNEESMSEVMSVNCWNDGNDDIELKRQNAGTTNNGAVLKKLMKNATFVQGKLVPGKYLSPTHFLWY